MVSGSQIRPTMLLIERETERGAGQEVRSDFSRILSHFFEMHEAAQLPDKRIIKHPSDVGKTKHISQFAPLITGFFQTERRVLYSNQIFTV